MLTEKMKRSSWHALRLFLIPPMALPWLVAPLPVGAETPPAVLAALPPIQPGEVISLLGNRNELWIADDQGSLHFAGDTRALTGKAVDWSYRLLITPEAVRQLPRGEPWLSTALVVIDQ